MAKDKENGGQTATVGQGQVEERDVDLASVDLTTPAKSQSPMTAIAGGETKNVGRFEFIRAAQTYQPQTKVVDLPAPFEGRQIKVRELTAGERDLYEGKMVKGRIGNQKIDLTELRVGLIIMAAVEWDDVTKPLFKPEDKEDLKKMGINVIQSIYTVASELSSVTKEAEDELMGE